MGHHSLKWLEFFINGTISGIKTAITNHLEMFFGNMTYEAFDKIYDRNGFLNILVIFVTIVMKVTRSLE